MDAVEFEHMKNRVGFTSSDAVRLRELGAVLASKVPRVVELFYEQLLADPQARAIFTSDEQIDRQRLAFGNWMQELFGGVYDGAYLKHRSEIGRAHVRVELPQRFMLTAMSIVRTELCRAIQELELPDEQLKMETLNKLLDLELAIMLESFREDHVAKIRAADKRAMDRQLAEVQHLAMVGQLAASLAHEIKNPIAGISGAIQIISQGMDKSDPHYEIMREILRQIDRLDTTVKDLLVYARPKPPERRLCDIGETVRGCLALLSEDPTIKSMSIEHHGLEAGIQIMLDQAQFSQVVANVIHNAAQACRGQGSIRISLQPNASGVELTVSDDGPGMTKEVVERALEPFFTTKARGSGLGLPICNRIIEAHQGELIIDTSPSRGTTIRIHLPGPNKLSVHEDAQR